LGCHSSRIAPRQPLTRLLFLLLRRIYRAPELFQLLATFGLVLVIEGLIYAGFPRGVKQMMALAQEMPESRLRAGGLAAAATGLFIVWLIRG
jgi:uncharacterized protein YjeT (DUF2065 family)